jgi:hypothetical protein
MQNLVFTDNSKYFEIGVVHGAFRECGDTNLPTIFARLEDPQILTFIHAFTQFQITGEICHFIITLIKL